MNQLTVSSSPHIRSPRTTQKVMLDVIIALLPVSVAAVIIFGAYSLALIATCVIASVASEFLFNLACKKEQTIYDLSAVVTGLILALNLPKTVNLWQAAVGSVIAIVVVKCLFGGIGKNFANPAMVGRIVLFLSFSAKVAGESNPVIKSLGGIDTVSGATPLSESADVIPSKLQLLLGLHGGSIGETCAIALLIGGVYLIARRVITWHIPVAFIGSVMLCTLLANEDPVMHALSGGLLIGAIFMATDYVTSPETPWGKIIFGVGCGLITSLIRLFGSFPEGVSFAILLMNILSPYIEKWTVRRPLGTKKVKGGEAK